VGVTHRTCGRGASRASDHRLRAVILGSPSVWPSLERRGHTLAISIRFDFALEPDEIAAVKALPPSAWFTAVRFENFDTEQTPALAQLDGANERKTVTATGWMRDIVTGRTVLDTFSANGAFSFLAQRLGARSICGIEWDPDRVEAASLVSSFVQKRDPDAAPLEFRTGDVYHLTQEYQTPFEVSLCLGGLYHVADPAHVLRQLRQVTTEYLVVQTSSILKGRGNRAAFRVRSDQTDRGLSSIVGGSGKWYMTAECFRQLLAHGGFEIVEERVNIPAYSALCRCI
jgi:tRNA (mo5U34)-methyltransferase